MIHSGADIAEVASHALIPGEAQVHIPEVPVRGILLVVWDGKVVGEATARREPRGRALREWLRGERGVGRRVTELRRSNGQGIRAGGCVAGVEHLAVVPGTAIRESTVARERTHAVVAGRNDDSHPPEG